METTTTAILTIMEEIREIRVAVHTTQVAVRTTQVAVHTTQVATIPVSQAMLQSPSMESLQTSTHLAVLHFLLVWLLDNT